MSCKDLKNIAYDCKAFIGLGGITEAIFVLSNDRKTGADYEVDEETHKYVKLGYDSAAVEFYLTPNTANYAGASAFALETNTYLYNHTFTLVITRREAAKSAAIQVMSEGFQYIDVIYKDANGYVWVIENARLSQDDENSGTAKADNSSYNLTFTAESSHKLYEFPVAIYDTIKDFVPTPPGE